MSRKLFNPNNEVDEKYLDELVREIMSHKGGHISRNDIRDIVRVVLAMFMVSNAIDIHRIEEKP